MPIDAEKPREAETVSSATANLGKTLLSKITSPAIETAPQSQPASSSESDVDDVAPEPHDEAFCAQEIHHTHQSQARLTLIFISWMCLVAVAAFYSSAEHSRHVNVFRGIAAAILVFLSAGLIVFPSGPFTRPHPAFWRFVFGVSVVYLLCLTVILFQEQDDARYVVSLIDANIGHPFKEKSVAENCDFNFTNVKNNIFDVYFACHLFGWVAKTLILRDRGFCWAISITWELVEHSFTHMMPFFAECWWDSLFLDLFGANALGIFIGYTICEYLNLKPYYWSGLQHTPDRWKSFKKVLFHLTPASWLSVRWHQPGIARQAIGPHLLYVFVLLFELNGFLLKHVLMIPAAHPLNFWRLVLFFFMGMVTTRQCYLYIMDPSCHRLGVQSWVAYAIVITEFLVFYKFGRHHFDTPMPANWKAVWTSMAVGYALLCLAAGYKFSKSKNQAQLKTDAEPVYLKESAQSIDWKRHFLFDSFQRSRLDHADKPLVSRIVNRATDTLKTMKFLANIKLRQGVSQLKHAVDGSQSSSAQDSQPDVTEHGQNRGEEEQLIAGPTRPLEGNEVPDIEDEPTEPGPAEHIAEDIVLGSADTSSISQHPERVDHAY